MTNITAPLAPHTADYIDSVAVFATLKRTIISKDFTGGSLNIFFGTVDVDFTHADIQGLVVLNISQAFGETTLTVPSDWRVETDQTLALAQVEDKRTGIQRVNTGKVLIITGTSVFANITIREAA